MSYVRGCLHCQKLKPILAGKATEGMCGPIRGLFEIVSIDFASPLPITPMVILLLSKWPVLELRVVVASAGWSYL